MTEWTDADEARRRVQEYNETFKQIYIGDWRIDRRLWSAVVEWCRYKVVCEQFDRAVCSGPVGPGGGILPRTPEERRKINRHAHEAYDRTVGTLRDLGLSEIDIRAARREVMRMSYEEAAREVEPEITYHRPEADPGILESGDV